MIFYIVYTLGIILLTATVCFFIFRAKYKMVEPSEPPLIKGREEFEIYFHTEFHRARRIEKPLALIFIKSENYNDLVTIVKDSIKRDTDFPAHYEDDIIAILLFNTDSNGAEKIVSRILNNPIKLNKFNIGINAAIPNNHTSSVNIINEAHTALLKSISSGGNSIEYSVNSI